MTGSRFVSKSCDIICGANILQEGFGRGVGYDIRERKIWSTFRRMGNNIDLRVTAVTPDETNLDQFSEHDWLIGNHSDELTPWVSSKIMLLFYSCIEVDNLQPTSFAIFLLTFSFRF